MYVSLKLASNGLSGCLMPAQSLNLILTDTPVSLLPCFSVLALQK